MKPINILIIIFVVALTYLFFNPVGETSGKASNSIPTIEQMVSKPDDSGYTDKYPRDDGGYNYEYQNHQLGQEVTLVWRSPDKWWLNILEPTITPDDLGNKEAVLRTIGSTEHARYKTSMGILYTQYISGKLAIRSPAYQQEFMPHMYP